MSPIARLTLRSERGVALVTTMLLLMLTSAILAGFLVTAVGDVRLRAVDRSRTQALYAAHAALEKLTADLGDLFQANFAPRADELTALEALQPEIENFTFEAEDGLGYDIAFTDANADGNPDADSGVIVSGPFQGFIGLRTPYTLTVTSRNALGAESRLQRTMQTVSIPVFQFGVFSETDLTFSANGTFSFGGRVHTNGNLFLAASSSGGQGELYLREKVTAVGEVIRTHLANSRTIDATHNGTVMINTTTGNCPGTSSPFTICRPLAASEGSLTGNVGSSANSNWMNIFGTYNGYLRNHLNGITSLQLPLVSDEVGGAPIDLIKRPVSGEEPLLTSQRLFAQAGIRILLSDTAAGITDLPGVTSTTPIPLGTTHYATVQATPTFRPPFAATEAAASSTTCSSSPGTTGSKGYCTPAGVPLLGGHLKVEYRDANNVWHDVTTEWLDLGYTRRNIDRATIRNSNSGTVDCNEPNPDAIIRIQRIKPVPRSTNTSSASNLSNTICNTIPNGLGSTINAANPSTPVATDYWPLTFYDTREGYNRQDTSGPALDLRMAGVMHYIDLDIDNLRRWLAGDIGSSGDNVVNENGYTVYFSDRRGNRNTAGNETGEFGWEDNVNPGAGAAGTPNGGGTPDDGEDVNSNGVLDLYGGTPRTRTAANVLSTSFTNWVTPFTSSAVPYATFAATNSTTAPNSTSTYNTPQYRARANPPLFFRRALKLTNGGLGSLPSDGLTIAAENPVYIEGHYNAGPTSWGNSAPAAIMADSITLLSANWDTVQQGDPENDGSTTTTYFFGHGDTRSFYMPAAPARRPAANTWYRFAALAGKTRNWAQTWEAGSFGTDGGVHNFLRYIESWSGVTINYRGSLASFYYSRQGTGLFRCCANVYQLPSNRNLSFDTNFLDPALLPPKTPMFRDVNTTGFIQVTRR